MAGPTIVRPLNGATTNSTPKFEVTSSLELADIYVFSDAGQSVVVFSAGSPTLGTRSFQVPYDANWSMWEIGPSSLSDGQYWWYIEDQDFNATGGTFYVSSVPSVEDPLVNPDGGNFYIPTSVSLSCTTSGATIRYTTNGADVTSVSTAYSSFFTLSQNTTLKTKAFKDTYNDSNPVSKLFGFYTATPTMSPSGGTYSGSVTVTISCSTPDSVIYCTSNGNTPTATISSLTANHLYDGPFRMFTSNPIKAIAIAPIMNTSSMIANTFTNSSYDASIVRVRRIGGHANKIANTQGQAGPDTMFQAIRNVCTGTFESYTTVTLNQSTFVYFEGNQAFGNPNENNGIMISSTIVLDGIGKTITMSTEPDELATPSTLMSNFMLAHDLPYVPLVIKNMKLCQPFATSSSYYVTAVDAPLLVENCFIACKCGQLWVGQAANYTLTVNNCTIAYNGNTLDYAMRIQCDSIFNNNIISYYHASTLTVNKANSGDNVIFNNNTFYNENPSYNNYGVLFYSISDSETIIGNPSFSCGVFFASVGASVMTAITKTPELTSLSFTCLNNANSFSPSTDILGRAR